MKECSFCKDALTDATAFVVKSPQGDESFTCSDCMEDINNFFKSGKAEKRKIETEKPHLIIKPSPKKRDYGFFGLFDGEEREYENVFIQSIDTKGLKNFLHYGNRPMSVPARSVEDFFNPSSPNERRGYEFSLSGVAFIDREKPDFFNDDIPF